MDTVGVRARRLRAEILEGSPPATVRASRPTPVGYASPEAPGMDLQPEPLQRVLDLDESIGGGWL